MRAWSPKVTENGWYPKLSPVGTHVLYGFWETHLANLETGIETRIVSPTGARIHPLGWLDASTIILGTEEGPAAIYRLPLALIRPVNGAFTVPVSCDLNVPSHQVPFNWGNARAGHWAISNSNRPWHIKDGVPFRQDVGNQYGVFIAGDHLVTMDKDKSLIHFQGTTIVRTVPPDNAFVVNEHGDILTGYYGVVHCYPSGQPHVDATIAPWKTEGIGAVPVRVGDDLWIWTFTEIGPEGNKEQLALGRRLGETEPIVVHNFVGATGGSDVVVVGEDFVLASNDPKGRMRVVWVPIDTPREKLVIPPIVALAPNVPSVAFAGYWRASHTSPGNCAIGGPDNPFPPHACIIEGEATILSFPKEQRLGLLIYLVADMDDDQVRSGIQRGLAFAAEHELVPFIYDDQRKYRFTLIKNACGPRAWVAKPQWYLRANQQLLDAHEAPLAFARDVIAQAQAFHGHPFLPDIRATSGGWKIPESDVVEALNELIRQDALKVPGCLGWLFWAGMRRDGIEPGLNDEDQPIPLPSFRAAIDLWMKTPTTVTHAQAWAAKFLAFQTPRSITITDYHPKEGPAPLTVDVDYLTTGEFVDDVYAYVDGASVATAKPPQGRMTFVLNQPRDYRLSASVTGVGGFATTQRERIIRVLPATQPPPEIPGITFPTQPGAGTAESARKPSQDAADAARKEEGQG